MTIGTIFKAKDKLNRVFTYELVAIDPENKMREYILQDINNKDGLPTEVEAEWFNQRQITILSKN